MYWHVLNLTGLVTAWVMMDFMQFRSDMLLYALGLAILDYGLGYQGVRGSNCHYV